MAETVISPPSYPIAPEGTVTVERPPLDDMSGVTMDPELGQRLRPGEVINFDYEQYRSVAQSLGATQKEIDSTHVDVLDKANAEKDGGGYYKNVDGIPVTAVVYKGSSTRDAEKMSKRLAHETQHRLDFERGVFDKSDLKEGYSKSSERQRRGAAQLMAGVAALIGAKVGVPEIPGALLAVGGAASLPLGLRNLMRFQATYAANPAELKAKSAEKFGQGKKIISTT